jgi:integrase
MPAKAVARDRVLSDAELRTVWRCLQELGYPYGHFAQLLTLTAQRKSEVAGMRWEEIDFAEALWSIPARRNKSARAHVVPLSPVVVKILRSLPKLHNEQVFPLCDQKRTLHDFSRWKRQLDEACRFADWRIHDLRRTAATGMARMSVEPHVIERVLNHTTGTLGGVAGVYNRFGYLPEMRAALGLWDQHVTKLVSEIGVAHLAKGEAPEVEIVRHPWG